MMGRRQKLIDGDEYDLVCAKKYHSFRSGIAAWIKRKMARRARKEARKEVHNVIQE